MTDTLSVSDVARIRGTSRQSALEWLQRNAREHLRRERNRLVISARMYARISGQSVDRAIAKKLEEIAESIKELESRVDAHGRVLGKVGAR